MILIDCTISYNFIVVNVTVISIAPLVTNSKIDLSFRLREKRATIGALEVIKLNVGCSNL